MTPLLFLQDHNMEVTSDMSSFFSAHYSQTAGCLARAVVNNVLTGGSVTPNINLNIENDMCKIT